MAQDWQILTSLTGGRPFQVERVRLTDADIAVDGRFDLPPLAQLPAEDQVFVSAFVRCHGSIKRMEQLFGVSYPTIKNRLNRIGSRLPTVEVALGAEAGPRLADLLEALERGESTASEVLARLKAGRAPARADEENPHD
jgi:hypothetical protein